MDIKTTVTIIGAGATGLAIAIELIKAGIDFIVLEKGSPGMGATCHSAGVLHSGARYAFTDPSLAKLCFQANTYFNSTIPFTIINKRDAYYVITDSKSELYAQKLLQACENLKIPVRYVDKREISQNEPYLANNFLGGLAVPDVSMDPFLLISSYVEYIRRKKATILANVEIHNVHQKQHFWRLKIHDKLTNRDKSIVCKVVIIAAGAWTTSILKLFGVDIPVQYVNGSMFVVNRSLINRIISMCNPPSSCDSFIPCYGNTLIGSTWQLQNNPNPSLPTFKDYDKALASLSRVISDSQKLAINNAYSGVRTIFASSIKLTKPINRLTKRNFLLLDHEYSKGTKNLLSVFGCKLTLHNLVAQETAKLVCKKLQIKYQDLEKIEKIEPPFQNPNMHLGSIR